jgi:hypothetical protein
MMPGMGGGTGLQLRVREGGRARVVQVAEHAADRPIRVGSGEGCDIRIPSTAPVHCELFIHGGRWVVRHSAGEAGKTWVNDKLVSKGAYLKAEDRIVLGDAADAAVIEVGPVAGVPPAETGRPTAPDAIPELMMAGGDGAGAEAWLKEDEDEHVPFSVPTRHVRPRTGRRKSDGGTGWTILFVLLVIAGAGAAVWKLRPTPETPRPQPVANKAVPSHRSDDPPVAARAGDEEHL